MYIEQQQQELKQIINSFLSSIPTLKELDPSLNKGGLFWRKLLEITNFSYTTNDNDGSSQLIITLKNNAIPVDDTDDLPIEFLKISEKLINDFKTKIIKLFELEELKITSFFEIYNHPCCGTYLTYHESDYNCFFTLNQFLD